MYDVNPPEGFNLRRDVYVRVSAFVKNLMKQKNEYEWILVLPPWGEYFAWKKVKTFFIQFQIFVQNFICNEIFSAEI